MPARTCARLVMLAVFAGAAGVLPAPAHSQNCTYHAEGNSGDWVECAPSPPGPALAPEQSWGAIAISPSALDDGWSSGMDTRAGAEKDALLQCATHGAHDCKVVMWVEHRCMALATSYNERAFGAVGSINRAQARRGALEQCRIGGGRQCTIIDDECT